MVSVATPPQTIAPRRPLPMGIASVQCLASPLKITFKAFFSVSFELLDDDDEDDDGFHKSLSKTGLTMTHSSSLSSIFTQAYQKAYFFSSIAEPTPCFLSLVLCVYLNVCVVLLTRPGKEDDP